MNYETATDFELELKLVELLGLELSPISTEGFVVVYPHNNVANANYCTDWNATMPLAVEYHLSIDPRKSIPKLGYMVSLDDKIYAVDKDLLRAIVICLIKVLGAKQ